MSRRRDTRGAELTGSLVMDGGEAPGGSAGAAEDGWADPQRDDLPRGLAVDGVAPIGRGGSARLRRSRRRSRGAAQPAEDPARPSDRAAPARSAAGPERLIGLHLIDLVDEAGYLREPLEEVAARLGCPLAAVEAVLAAPAAVRSARRVRPLAQGMPGAAAARGEPARSGDGGAARPSRSAGRGRHGRRSPAAAGLPRTTCPT